MIGLQTNFGGGKTHSLLALHHLFSGVAPAELVGVEQILKDAGATDIPNVKRAVLVGTAIGPAKVHEKPDGTKVHTLWGELAWQLGGKEGYELLAEADTDGVSPGSDVRKSGGRGYPASCLAALEIADRVFGVASEVVGSIEPAEPRSAGGVLRALRGTVRGIRPRGRRPRRSARRHEELNE